MKGILLHGGHGTRLRPLTHTGPKQLLPIANKPMSQYCIESMKEAGVKRGGIILAKEGKFLIEMQGTEKMELPVKEKETELVDEQYFKVLLEKANLMLERNYTRLEKLENEFKKNLK